MRDVAKGGSNLAFELHIKEEPSSSWQPVTVPPEESPITIKMDSEEDKNDLVGKIISGIKEMDKQINCLMRPAPSRQNSIDYGL